MRKAAYQVYQQVTALAEAHGRDSDPEHEAGDLQAGLVIVLNHVPDDLFDSLRRDLRAHDLIPENR